MTEQLMTRPPNKRAAPTIPKVAVVEEHPVHLLSGVCTIVGYTVGYTPREDTNVEQYNLTRMTQCTACV